MKQIIAVVVSLLALALADCAPQGELAAASRRKLEDFRWSNGTK